MFGPFSEVLGCTRTLRHIWFSICLCISKRTMEIITRCNRIRSIYCFHVSSIFLILFALCTKKLVKRIERALANFQPWPLSFRLFRASMAYRLLNDCVLQDRSKIDPTEIKTKSIIAHTLKSGFGSVFYRFVSTL